MTPVSYKKIVQFGAMYDIVATTPLAVPFITPFALQLIQWIDETMGLATAFQPLDPSALFLINLGGCAYLVWAFARLKMTSRELGRLDGILRFMVVSCQIWAVCHGASPILLGLAVGLAVIGALEMWPVQEGGEIGAPSAA